LALKNASCTGVPRMLPTIVVDPVRGLDEDLVAPASALRDGPVELEAIASAAQAIIGRRVRRE
jgi:hypothetical protein